MKYSSAILFLLSVTFVRGQKNSLLIERIDSIVKFIDTTSTFKSTVSFADGFKNLRDKNSKIINTTGPGGSTDSYNRIIGNKPSERLALFDISEMYDYFDDYKYYFYHDSLVYITVKRDDAKNNKKAITDDKYYYWNNNLIDKEEQGTSIKKPEALLQQAQILIKDIDNG